jgi:hypothetical protein
MVVICKKYKVIKKHHLLLQCNPCYLYLTLLLAMQYFKETGSLDEYSCEDLGVSTYVHAQLVFIFLGCLVERKIIIRFCWLNANPY